MMITATVTTLSVIVIYGLLYLLLLPTLSLMYVEGYIFIGTGIMLLVTLSIMWLNVTKKNYKYNDGMWIVVMLVFLAMLLADMVQLIPTNSLIWMTLYLILLIALIIIDVKVIWYTWKVDELDTRIIPIISILVFFSILIIGQIASSLLFHSTAMYNQIGQIEEKSFTEDLVEVDNSQIPTVDIPLADVLGDKKLGEELALGSQTNVGEYTNKQSVNGKLIYAAPLEHSGLFKWLNNMSGTTGFIKISATNANNVELVRGVNIKYLQSAFFGDDLERHIRLSGFATQGLTEYSFELNDEGKPFWVITTFKNTTFWANPEATGVVICDPESGECNWYSVEDAPAWVDIIQPEDFVINQIRNYGRLVHGPFNFSNKDELSMTEHITTVYNAGGCYYYTGLSSVGTDNGTVGFILINTRTKAAKLYRMVGATEDSAISSAEGKVQNMHYTATTPIPLNVSGVPTYFCTLKDDAGLVKQYAMVNIEDFSIVETGTSIMEAKRAYINAVNASGRSVDFSSDIGNEERTGVVTRIGNNIENNSTYYYIMLDNDMTKLYLAAYSVSEELPVTREGDKVTIGFSDSSGKSINLLSFDNINIAN